MQKTSPDARTRSSSWWGSRCPASACCCSCGSPSAARSRSSRRATASTSPSSEATSARQRGRRAHLRRPGRQGQDGPARTATGRPSRRSSSTPEYAPMPADARAILRQKTLLGETYVELTPGTRTRDRRSRRAARCRRRRSSPTVELDEIFRAFDDEDAARASRSGCRTWRSRRDRARPDLSDAFGNLAPFAEDTNDLLRSSSAAGRRAAARAQHRRGLQRARPSASGQLSGLITNANTVFQTTADKQRAARGGLHGAPDLRAREPPDAQPPRQLRAQHQPGGRRAAALARAS